MINTSMDIHAQSFDFSITTYCQAKCRSCMRTDEHTGETVSWLTPSHMSYEKFDKILNGSKNVNLYRLEFCGELGDPMMHPEVERFIDRGLEQVDHISINTNGGLRQPAWYEHAAKKYKTGDKLRILWGIDGMNHDINWKYREGVNWQRAMDNMSTWFNNGGGGEWHFLIFEWNWHQIPIAKEYADKHGIEIYFKMNDRDYGLISPQNEQSVYKLLEECDAM